MFGVIQKSPFFFKAFLSFRQVPVICRLGADTQYDEGESSILRQLSNPVCGSSMTEQVRLCAVWRLAHGELPWIFHEPHTGLDDCLKILLLPSSY